MGCGSARCVCGGGRCRFVDDVEGGVDMLCASVGNGSSGDQGVNEGEEEGSPMWLRGKRGLTYSDLLAGFYVSGEFGYVLAVANRWQTPADMKARRNG